MKTLLIIFLTLVTLIVLIFNINNIMGLWIGHYANGDKVYYRTWHSWKWFQYSTRDVPDADAASIKKLSFCYGKDKVHCFFEVEIIPGCDPEHFKVIDKNNSYARDENYVYRRAERLSDDPNHFELFERGWAKDCKQVYRNGKIIPMDAASLEFLDEACFYVADKNIITFEGKEMIGVDRETFEILEKGYSKDKYRKYRYSQPIPGAKATLAQ